MGAPGSVRLVCRPFALALFALDAVLRRIRKVHQFFGYGRHPIFGAILPIRSSRPCGSGLSHSVCVLHLGSPGGPGRTGAVTIEVPARSRLIRIKAQRLPLAMMAL